MISPGRSRRRDAAQRGGLPAYPGAMYESVRGRLLGKEPTRCVVEAGGFGWSIGVPLSTAERLPEVGAEVFLRLHLVVPERGGEWRLFGFVTDDERRLFRACLGVSGVGPSTALALLAGMPPAALRAAVAGGDVAALTRIKGVGRKTAERLVVELRDALAPGGDAAPPLAAPSGPLADAAAALAALGLDPAEVADRLRKLPDAASLPVEEVVRRALRPARGR